MSRTLTTGRRKALRLSRRAVLRGLVGGAAVMLGLPPLDAMFNGNGTAYASGEPIPLRFGIWWWGNGVRLSEWTPTETGAGWTPTPLLEPLAPVKAYVSVLSGMQFYTGNERGHHAGCVALLSAAPMVVQDPNGAPFASTFSEKSIDQRIAEHWGTLTRFPTLEVGVSKKVVVNEGTTLRYLSHNGPDNANPPEYEPGALFDRLFGPGFVPPGEGPAEPDPSLRLRRSVLDAVLADAARLRERLGATDRARLDQHLEGIRQLERRIAAMEMGSGGSTSTACARPEPPGAYPDIEGKEQITERNAVMAELVAMALACDQTRIFTNLFTGSSGGTVFYQAGADRGIHELTHGEPGDQPTVKACTRYTMEQLAVWLEALRSIPEGDGNLLDHCAILAASDVAEGRTHSLYDLPILVCGRAGGALVHPGIHYRSETRENTTKVHLALLMALGLPYTEFGTGGGYVDAPLSAILA
ncbi:MAG: DUF1552 domain-containing protein [Deltaproteobacteria bacterium]|nr:MAG: DUF1552 domain-containing protein [Deltaproteobacteria bacterium]